MDAETGFNPGDYVTLAKAAHIAEVSEQTFRKWINNGEFTPYRKGKKNPNAKHDFRPIFIRKADLTDERIMEAAA